MESNLRYNHTWAQIHMYPHSNGLHCNIGNDRSAPARIVSTRCGPVLQARGFSQDAKSVTEDQHQII